MTAAEIKFLVLLAVMWLLAVLIAFDPFDTVDYTYRTGGLLVVGPILTIYGILGLKRGGFPEIIDASRDKMQWKFWLCAVTYIVLGLGAILVGVDAIAGLGIVA
jgi:hypothetical protein